MNMDPKKWNTRSRAEVLQHPRVHLVEDEVELPDGNTTKYLRYAPVKAHSVGIVAVNDKQQILLQREYSYPPDKVMWQLPGGGINKNEKLEVAASRELSEESGYIAEKCELLGSFYTNNRRSDEQQFIVYCSELQTKKSASDPEEFINSHWVNLDDLKLMIKKREIENINLLAALNFLFIKLDK